jgi:predicted metalloprotease with PDZ domain
VTPAEAEALFDEISGGRFKPFFDKYMRGTDDLPLAKLLAPFGVKYSDERKSAKPSLDVNLGKDGNDCKLNSVHEAAAPCRSVGRRCAGGGGWLARYGSQSGYAAVAMASARRSMCTRSAVTS